MPRRAQLDVSEMSDFARWLAARLEQRGLSLGALAGATGVNVSYLHKILKSYRPQYRQYQRPGYDKTVALGRSLGDVAGALEAAGYEQAPATDGEAIPGAGRTAGGVPENTEDWPPELLEAMHYSQALSPDVQRYIYGLWREQARVYAALAQSRPDGAGASLVLAPSGDDGPGA